METRQDVSNAYQNPAGLLQRLIRFDTTNPPGNESACLAYIGNLLGDAGIEYKLLAKTPERPNLIARLPGRGQAPPLLLYGHVDVVTIEDQPWRHAPFAGEQSDGVIWGRGALDMKGGVTMMLAAMLRARAENLNPPGDVILALVCDEEAGGDLGARFLVEEHPEEFAGVRYALGEFGGFTLFVGKRRFYPIQVAEKQICWLQATFRGPCGHGSMPVRGGAMAKMAHFLKQVDTRRLPVHITPPARLMFNAMAEELGGLTGLMLRQLLNPSLAEHVLGLLGDRSQLFDPLLHHTVSPTVVAAGNKINVIPSEVHVGLDCRLLPGFQPEDVIRELRHIAGETLEIDVKRYDPGPAATDMGLFGTLASILKEADPQGVPIPLLLSAVTDGRFFSRLGIQTYGYLPMRLQQGFSFTHTIHGVDECIPVEAVEFGANAIYQVIQRCGTLHISVSQ